MHSSIFINLLPKVAASMAGWHLMWTIIKKMWTADSKKYKMAIFQASHSFIFIYKAILICAHHNSEPLLIKQYENIMCMSIAYFIYDNFGKPFPTVYTVHHFLAVFGLMLLKFEVRYLVLFATTMMEMSNIPLFYAYGLRNAHVPNKALIRRCDYITFVVYALCRVILYSAVFMDPLVWSNKFYIMTSMVWYAPGITWTIKMYNRLNEAK